LVAYWGRRQLTALEKKPGGKAQAELRTKAAKEMRAHPEKYGLSGATGAEAATKAATAGQHIMTPSMMALATAVNAEMRVVKKENGGWRVHRVKPSTEGALKGKGKKAQDAAVIWLHLEEKHYKLLKLKVGELGPDLAEAKNVEFQDALEGAGKSCSLRSAMGLSPEGAGEGCSLRQAMGLSSESDDDHEEPGTGMYTSGDVFACPCGWRPQPQLRKSGKIVATKQQAKAHWRACRGTPPPPAQIHAWAESPHR
jgi:hypothetical protein